MIEPQRELVEMVAQQIEARGVRDERVLEAMRQVPRREFVLETMRGCATDDRPLPIGFGQTISQPYIVGLMTELLELKGDESMLEIGTGSGYQAAVLSLLAELVHTLEFVPELALKAQKTLENLGYLNIKVHTGDGSMGLSAHAPYDGILVTAACPAPPPPLLEQLAEGGKLVIPVGDRWGQMLQCWEKNENHLSHEDVLPVAFVPLRGKFGWKEDQW
jgi:protein-L-isoaspartate(D-aspartate) O-methyltransferase